MIVTKYHACSSYVPTGCVMRCLSGITWALWREVSCSGRTTLWGFVRSLSSPPLPMLPSISPLSWFRVLLSHRDFKTTNGDNDKGTLTLINRETMLSKTPLDLILILSPSELHVPQALLCLKYKKHIFIEKPLANTLSEVDELENARAESGMIVFVGYMRRYAAAVEVVKERLKGKGIKYVTVRELIGSVSPCSSPLRLCSLDSSFYDE